jgi:hypothetical protein
MTRLGIKKLAAAVEEPQVVSKDVAIDAGSTASNLPTGGVLLGVTDPVLLQSLVHGVERLAAPPCVTVASSLAQLNEIARQSSPGIIFLDSDLLGGLPLCESLRSLAGIAPVLVLASLNSQAEIAKLVAGGNVEFIARVGDFKPLACALIERRLKWAQVSDSAIGELWTKPPSGMGEIFRHEINNPLTGILGNTELVLAHRDHLSPVEIHRLETVVSLAIRLRESIRRLSNAWEGVSPASKSV